MFLSFGVSIVLKSGDCVWFDRNVDPGTRPTWQQHVKMLKAVSHITYQIISDVDIGQLTGFYL